MPEMCYPEAWFETMDVAHRDVLTLSEVFQAVAATMAVSSRILDDMLPSMWSSHGKALEDPMRFEDLFGENGLILQLQQRVAFLTTGVDSVVEAPCPDFMFDKRAWFEHWDTDRSGWLEREEVVRGLAKSFRSDVPARLCRKRLRMRFLVDEMWPAVDVDGSDTITLDEFCRVDGLADLILRNFTAKGSPRSPRELGGTRSSGQGPVLRRKTNPGGDKRLSQRKTWPDSDGCGGRFADVDGAIDGDDRPSLLSRPSLGFSESPSNSAGGCGTPTSSGLPGASWSVLARRRCMSASADSISASVDSGFGGYGDAARSPSPTARSPGRSPSRVVRSSCRSELLSPLGARSPKATSPRSGSPRSNRRRATKDGSGRRSTNKEPAGFWASFTASSSSPFHTAPV